MTDRLEFHDVWWLLFNPFRASDANMRQKIKPSLVQIQACRLLPEPMLIFLFIGLLGRKLKINNDPMPKWIS